MEPLNSTIYHNHPYNYTGGEDIYNIDFESGNTTFPIAVELECIGFKPPYKCNYTWDINPRSCDLYPPLQKSDSCWRMSPQQRFLTYTVAIGIVALFGLIGNTLSIIVLMKDNSCSNNSGVFLLKALAFADNIFLLVILCYYSLWFGLMAYLDTVMGYGYYEMYLRSLPYLRTFGDRLVEVAHTAAIWMTVLLAFNRYIAVCHPLHALRYCTNYKARIQVSIILVSCVIFNIPNFCWNYLSHTTAYNHRTQQVETLGCVEHTNSAVFRSYVFQLIYTRILSTIILGILPMLLLVILNTKIILTIRRVQVFQRQNITRASNNTNIAATDNNISVIMVTIMVVFIVCRTADRLSFAVKELGE